MAAGPDRTGVVSGHRLEYLSGLMDLILLIGILLLSVILHEVAHAWVARREGDDTAERLGRITLNPIPHLDPIGSILIPVVLASLPGGFIFGWAKPVPVNPANFRDPVWGDIRVSLAGIAVNLLLALVFALAMIPLVRFAPAGGAWGYVESALYYGVLINVILAVFNLIPVPPLDGSHVVRHLLPQSLRGAYDAFGRFGAIALLAFLFFVPGGFGLVMGPVMFIVDSLFAVLGL
jgi:Zn-dependent protease